MTHDALAPDLPRDLARPEAHPEDPSASGGVSWVQTHISHVFLTRERVVKLRKAVRLSFLDFSSREARNADARREVRLNRRLAPDVYLGLAPVRRGPDGRFTVGPVDEEIGDEDAEHAVVMRRLPEGCDARSMLERGALGPGHLDAVADVLARFHAGQGLGRPAPWSAVAWQARTAAPMRANFETLRRAPAGTLPAEEVEAAARATEARLRALAPALEMRRVRGRAVDGHGDVHLEHVWFEDGDAPPRLIDCIEFDDDLRRVDVASEVAFLAMDLRYRGRDDLAARFLRRYAQEADDFHLFEVVDLFAAYRAGVRAKVAVLAAGEEEIEPAQREAAAQSGRRHLDLVGRLLAPRPPGALVLVCGTVGVGKSGVAARLADAVGGVVAGSDRTRKHLAGMEPTERAAEGGLYTPAMTDAVYRVLGERAVSVMRSGRAALLDATFARRAHRRAVGEQARRLGAAFHVVHVDCAPEVVRARLADRTTRGDDPSDAGPERVAPSRQAFEALEAGEADALHEVRTDRGEEALAHRLAAVAEALRSA